MKWKLQSEENNIRVYDNDTNSSTIQTNLIYTDKLDNKWWGFNDLFQIPYLRIAYSKTISDLFRIGLTANDLKTWIQKEKELLRAAKADPEQYEKLYALVLEKEVAINNTVDPLQQHLALCTIYILSEDEAIDQYSPAVATKKLETWKLDTDAQGFFLTWHTEHIAGYMKTLDGLSQIALTNTNGNKTPVL